MVLQTPDSLHQWFGDAWVDLAVNTGVSNAAIVDWAMYKEWLWAVTAGVSDLALVLPQDVRGEIIGGPVVKLTNHSTSTRNLVVLDGALQVVPNGTIAPNNHALVWLTDTSTAAGTYFIYQQANGPKAHY